MEVPPTPGLVAIERIIKAAVERGASDVHIKAGDVVRARVDGRLVALTRQALTPEQTRSLAAILLDGESVSLDTITDHDVAWAAPGVGRFRVNILRQRNAVSIVMRIIPEQVPTIASLGLPGVMANIAQAERGMVLVTGVTGSGKSSTMAALVHEINASQEKHILTLEEPIEFLHGDLKGSVTQREIGVDTDSFRVGLRAALRQDPDVIMIGEMRDAETIDTAMKAAETGHLLISTLHTPDAQSTIMRIMAMFPPDEQQTVRLRLAESLHAVVSQRLLPKKTGAGRVAACEVMLVTSTIRDFIADGNLMEIRDYIADGQQYGMQTFDQHLADLVNLDLVDFEVAKGAATNPADFELGFRMGKSRQTTGGGVLRKTSAYQSTVRSPTPRSSEPIRMSTPPMPMTPDTAAGAITSSPTSVQAPSLTFPGGTPLEPPVLEAPQDLTPGAPPAAPSLAAGIYVDEPIVPGSPTGSIPDLGQNPLGTGSTLPPLPSAAPEPGKVSSPNPLSRDEDIVFGSGFENLFSS